MRNRKIDKYENLLRLGGYIKQSCGNYVLFSCQDLAIYAIDKLSRYIIIDVKNKTVYWRAITAYLIPYYWINVITGYCKARYGFVPKVYDCKLDYIYKYFSGVSEKTFLYKRDDI